MKKITTNPNLKKLVSILFYLGFSLSLVGCGSGDSSSSSSSSSSDSDNRSADQGGVVAFEFESSNYPVDIECDSETPQVSFSFDVRFNLDTALLLLQASYLTEQDIPLAEEHFLQWGFSSTKLFQNRLLGMRAYIAEHDEFVLVVYRGTTEPAEYLSNATFIMKPVPEYGDGAAMHQGFWSAHQATRDLMHEHIISMGGADKPVVFAGHSRGGALAIMQASYMDRQGGEVPFVYTFAQPRLGNKAFSESLKAQLGDRYYRMDYATDITPKVPPTADVAAPLYEDGYIPGFLASIVNNLGYDHDPGEAYVLYEGGFLTPDENLYETQLNFWVDFFIRYPNLLGSIGELVKALPENHKPSLYLCQLAKVY